MAADREYASKPIYAEGGPMPIIETVEVYHGVDDTTFNAGYVLMQKSGDLDALIEWDGTVLGELTSGAVTGSVTSGAITGTLDSGAVTGVLDSGAVTGTLTDGTVGVGGTLVSNLGTTGTVTTLTTTSTVTTLTTTATLTSTATTGTVTTLTTSTLSAPTAILLDTTVVGTTKVLARVMRWGVVRGAQVCVGGNTTRASVAEINCLRSNGFFVQGPVTT